MSSGSDVKDNNYMKEIKWTLINTFSSNFKYLRIVTNDYKLIPTELTWFASNLILLTNMNLLLILLTLAFRIDYYDPVWMYIKYRKKDSI